MSTSTVTSNDICARVRALWAAMLPMNLIPRADHNIALTIFAGMERLAKAVKESSDRALLMAELTNKTPAAGVLDLSGATYANYFIDTYRLPGALNPYVEAAVVFKHVPSLDALRATTPTDTACVWYHLRGKKLLFKHPTTGALDTYATAINLLGSYIPELGNANLPLPHELEGQLVDRVAELVQKLGGLQFLEADAEKAGEAVKGMQA